LILFHWHDRGKIGWHVEVIQTGVQGAAPGTMKHLPNVSKDTPPNALLSLLKVNPEDYKIESIALQVRCTRLPGR
jgi:hypothetical protein